jgi:hypothetical protein
MEYRSAKKSELFVTLIVAVWALCMPATTGAQDSEELYLLDFHADGFRLAESVPAYASADTLLIDFTLFVEALEFPIEREGDLWSGWFHAQDRHFVWRMDLGVVQSASKSMSGWRTMKAPSWLSRLWRTGSIWNYRSICARRS